MIYAYKIVYFMKKNLKKILTLDKTAKSPV